eukprot:258762-Hanusia_phi.AAC.3
MELPEVSPTRIRWLRDRKWMGARHQQLWSLKVLIRRGWIRDFIADLVQQTSYGPVIILIYFPAQEGLPSPRHVSAIANLILGSPTAKQMSFLAVKELPS